MPGRLRRHCVAATTALLLSTTVSACSGDSDESPKAAEPSASASASTGASASPSPSPSPTRKPKPPKAPPAKDTDAGRRAFAKFVIARWGFALRTNKAAALVDLSPKSGACEGCKKLRQELRKRKKQGWYVDFPGAKIVKLKVSPGDQPGVYLAQAKINVPRSTSYFEDGEVRNENKRHKGAAFEVRMRLDKKHYSLLAYRVS